jgi:hypothetical protein
MAVARVVPEEEGEEGDGVDDGEVEPIGADDEGEA